MSKDNFKSNATSVSTSKAEIEEGLKTLQAASVTVSNDLNRSRDSLYRHLCATYIWWQDAKKQPGYLDAEYAKLDKRPSRTKLQPNFHELIWLVCGENSGLTNSQADRYARAIHALHVEYENHTAKYAKNGESKLANFINSKGGVSKLAGYVSTHPDDNSSGSAGGSEKSGKKGSANQTANDELLKKAYAHAENSRFKRVEVDDGFPANEDNYSLLLVRKTDGGNTLISASDDTSSIEEVLKDTYKTRFDALQSVIRPLLELIQTQCYPKHLQHMTKKDAEKNKSDEMSGKKYKSAPRLVYLADQEKFMLSPYCSDSGVVSYVTLDAPILRNCTQDVFLPFYQRSILEHNFLQDFDFNNYTASEEDSFDEYGGDNSATHTLRLSKKGDAKKTIDLHFWPFYESFRQPMDQVALNPSYNFEPDWEAKLPHSWFVTLAQDFLVRWEETHGTQWSRENQKAIKVDFEQEKLRISFDYHDGEFDGEQLIRLNGGVSNCKEPSVFYKTKDWIRAMKAVSLLPVVGEVSISTNTEVCMLRFNTAGKGGVAHEIWIPGLGDCMERHVSPFTRYKPTPIEDEDGGSVDFEDEDPEAIAKDWPEAGGKE